MENNATYLYPKRKSPRFKGFDYSSSYAYHIVVVTRDRQKVFGEIRDGQMILNKDGIIAEEIIRQIPEHYPRVSIDEYTIMPDHVHLLLCVNGDPDDPVNPDIRSIMNALKALVSRQCGRPIWQRSFYDHIIRNDRDYQETINYIQGNPAEWEAEHL